MSRGRVFALILWCMLALRPLHAQPPQTGGNGLFEAISVKESSGNRIPGQWRGTRFVAAGIPLWTLLAVAYEVPLYQLTDLPQWVRATPYEIDAVATRAPARSEERVFLRALLEERFRILARTETQVRPIYNLVPARQDRQLGPGLRPTSVDCGKVLEFRAAQASAAKEGPACRVLIARDSYVRDGIPMALLADVLSTFLERPVFDRTGQTGLFDIELRFRPLTGDAAGPDATADRPHLVTALEEQLGLRLESANGPVQVTVFDRIERPSPN